LGTGLFDETHIQSVKSVNNQFLFMITNINTSEGCVWHELVNPLNVDRNEGRSRATYLAASLHGTPCVACTQFKTDKRGWLGVCYIVCPAEGF